MQNNTIEIYNPDVHSVPIKWFNSLKIRHIKLGKNEEIIKNCNVSNYPENSIVVKCYSENLIEINFMDKLEDAANANWWQRRSIRQNVMVFKRSERVADASDPSGFKWVLSPKFNAIQFKTEVNLNNGEEKGFSVQEMMTYINYIVKQVS